MELQTEEARSKPPGSKPRQDTTVLRWMREQGHAQGMARIAVERLSWSSRRKVCRHHLTHRTVHTRLTHRTVQRTIISICA